MKIAVSIVAITMRKALKDIKEAFERGTDLVELRIDYLEEKPDLEELLSVCNKYKLPAIVTNRSKDEGGHFVGSEEERVGYLREAVRLGATYVDIEFNHYRELPKKKTKIIVSYHDFDKTPENLRGIYYTAFTKTNADIIKIATKANSQRDVERMINLVKGAEGKIIGICMGKLGQETRLHPKNYLTFASLGRGKESADGQYTITEMRQLLKKAKGRK